VFGFSSGLMRAAAAQHGAVAASDDEIDRGSN